MAEQKEQIQNKQQLWKTELDAANDRQKEFWKTGDKVVKRYLDNRSKAQGNKADTTENQFRLNLFHQNVTTLLAMLYGRVPETVVKRKWADPDDDVARVASQILKRTLDNPLQDPKSGDSDALRNCLQDRLLPGIGQARIRYDFVSDSIEERTHVMNDQGMPEIQMQERSFVVDESAPLEYVHWRDFRWGYARVWADVPWVSFDVYMDKDEVTEKFGEAVAKKVDFEIAPKGVGVEPDKDQEQPWMKAKFTEIWDKKTRQVLWYHPKLDDIAKEVDAPLDFRGFFPCPQPLIANPTTDLFLPRSDYSIAQDLYNQIDVLQTRINIITKAVKVVGVYDQSQKGVVRMLEEGMDNDLIPVENWAMFAEGDRLKGAIDWFPIADVVDALNKLQEMRDEHIQLLYQITGMADILRGTSEQYTAASTDKLKAKFASIRVQYIQDEFARFASDLMSLRAEVVMEQFEEQTIAIQSNIEYLPEDPQIIQQALALVKHEDEALLWRIDIKPESIAMVDYAQLKAERTEYLTAVSTFLQSADSIGTSAPELAPALITMLKWGLAGFKGSEEIEGVLDRGLRKLEERLNNPQPQGKNPKVEEIEAKAKAEKQKQAQKTNDEMYKLLNQHKAKLIEIAAESDADARDEQMQAYFNILESEAKFEFDKELKEIDVKNRVEKRQPRS